MKINDHGFTATERRVIAGRISRLARRLCWGRASSDLRGIELLIGAADPAWHDYRRAKAALDAWDNLTKEERDAILHAAATQDEPGRMTAIEMMLRLRPPSRQYGKQYLRIIK